MKRILQEVQKMFLALPSEHVLHQWSAWLTEVCSEGQATIDHVDQWMNVLGYRLRAKPSKKVYDRFSMAYFAEQVSQAHPLDIEWVPPEPSLFRQTFATLETQDIETVCQLAFRAMSTFAQKEGKTIPEGQAFYLYLRDFLLYQYDHLSPISC